MVLLTILALINMVLFGIWGANGNKLLARIIANILFDLFIAFLWWHGYNLWWHGYMVAK